MDSGNLGVIFTSWSAVCDACFASSQRFLASILPHQYQKLNPNVLIDYQAQSAADKEPALFDWTKQWYPMAAVQDLDPAIPHPIKLLGMQAY